MRETVATLASRYLHNERRIWIRCPQRDAETRSLTVFLDAEMYREKMDACALLGELLAAARMADSWFVFVSSHSPEARWKECPCHPPFAAFLVDELLPWLQEREPRLAMVRHRTLVGLSYTGLAAAYVVQARPGSFERVIAQSGSFWWNDGALITAYESASAPVPTAFYLEVGRRETQSNLQHREDVFQAVPQIEAVKRFREVLAGRGHDVTYAETDGAHDATAWRAGLSAALAWALPMRPAGG